MKGKGKIVCEGNHKVIKATREAYGTIHYNSEKG